MEQSKRMEERPHTCPRCGSKMHISFSDSTLKSFPYVSLSCSKKECMWNLVNYVDDMGFGGESDRNKTAARLVKHFNEGCDNL